MPKKVAGLTARQVAAMTAPGLHAAGAAPGLYLQVTPGSGRSWVFRYQLAGKRRDMGIGPLDAIGLAEARQRATDARRMVLAGTDPIEARRIERAAVALSAAKAMTFKQCAAAYIAAHQAGWKNPVHAKQWPSTLETYVYPVFGDLPVQAVDVGLVMKAIEPIWSTKPETASRVRGRIESILDWATARGYRQGENPARWRGHLENLLPTSEQGAPGRASCRAALCRDRRLHGRAAAAGRRCRPRARIRDPDGGAHRRSASAHAGMRSTLPSGYGRSRPSG